MYKESNKGQVSSRRLYLFHFYMYYLTVKIHTEDPKRTNMDEVLPQIDFALEFPLQLFHGIEENQVVEHHQPALCQGTYATCVYSVTMSSGSTYTVSGMSSLIPDTPA